MTKTEQVLNVLEVALIEESTAVDSRDRIIRKMAFKLAAILGDPVQVVSSNLLSIQFNESVSMLTVQFKGGGAYTYDGVDFGLFESFMNAPSKGKFFHANIKGKFPHQKL